MVDAEREADDQVVDRERDAEDEQLPGVEDAAFFLPLDLTGAEALPDRIGAGKDQQPRPQVTAVTADRPGDRLADQEADDRHRSLEEAEGDPDPEPGPGVDPGQPDPDRPGEVAEANREAHQEQAEEISGQAASASSVAWKPAAPSCPPNGPSTGSVVPASW